MRETTGVRSGQDDKRGGSAIETPQLSPRAKGFRSFGRGTGEDDAA